MFMIHQAVEMAASHLTQEEIEALPSAGTPTRDTGFQGMRDGENPRNMMI